MKDLRLSKLLVFIDIELLTLERMLPRLETYLDPDLTSPTAPKFVLVTISGEILSLLCIPFFFFKDF
jgi:hypothetical protein